MNSNQYQTKPVNFKAFQVGTRFVPDWVSDLVTANAIITSKVNPSNTQTHFDTITLTLPFTDIDVDLEVGDWLVQYDTGLVYGMSKYMFSQLYQSVPNARNTLVLNIFGAPGTGKTVLMAEMFAAMKKAGVLCEFVPEAIKYDVYDMNIPRLKRQTYNLGRQHELIDAVYGKVDIIVTDSPVLLPRFYTTPDYPTEFNDGVNAAFDMYNNYNLFLTPNPNFGYQSEGRTQDEEQAYMKGEQILTYLTYHYQYDLVMAGTDEAFGLLFRAVVNHLTLCGSMTVELQNRLQEALASCVMGVQCNV